MRVTHSIMAAILVMMSACIPEQEYSHIPQQFTFILVDISGSIKKADREFYHGQLRALLGTPSSNDMFAISAITGNSGRSFRDLYVWRMPKWDLETTNKLKYDQMKKDALVALDVEVQGLLSAPPASRTDLLGGILVASKVLGQEPAKAKQLVILSDMIEQGELYDFGQNPPSSVDLIERILSDLKSRHMLPDLSGVDIRVTGAGNADSTTTSIEIENFWQEYFSRAGSPLLPGAYGVPLR